MQFGPVIPAQRLAAQGQQGWLQSSLPLGGRSSQSASAIPLQTAGKTGSPSGHTHAGLPAQTIAEQHAWLLQSLAVQGAQHKVLGSPKVPGRQRLSSGPTIIAGIWPAGHIVLI